MAIYYVDFTTGDDGDSGLTEALAWKTIGKVNGLIFDPGDSVLFKRGEVWRGTQLNFPSSGTSGQPITIGAYGMGARPLISVAIDISTAAYKWTLSGSGTNEYYCELAAGGDPSISTVEDIVIMDGTLLQEGTVSALADHEWAYGDNDTLGYNTVYVRDNSGDPDVTDVVIEAAQDNQSVELYGQTYITVDGLDIQGGDDEGVLIDGANCIVQNCTIRCNKVGITVTGANADYLTVDNCTIEYNYWSGIKFSTAGQSYQTITDNTIQHNGISTAAGAGAECGIIGYIDHATISGNTIQDNCHSVTYGTGHGIYVYPPSTAGSTGNVIHDNVIRDNPRGSGIKFSDGVGGDIHNNHIYGNWGDGIVVTDIGTATVTINIYYNIITGNGQGFLQQNTAATGVTALNIYNNVFYQNDNQLYSSTNADVRFFDDVTTHGTVNFKNNIVFGDTAVGDYYEFLSVNAQTGTFNVDYNLMRYGDIYYGGAERNWAYWTGTLGYDTHGLNTDPLFVNGSGTFQLATDFMLRSGSPCRNAGANVGLTQDYWGNPVPSEGTVDIGSHEISVSNISARMRQGKRLREARFTGIKTGVPTYVPSAIETRGFKLKFYDLSDVKIGELGADVQIGHVSEVEFELMDFGCGAFSFVVDSIPSFPISFRTRVDVHPYYDVTPWFTGFIQTIPLPGQKPPYRYAGFGFYEQLDWVTVTASYQSQEVSLIVKAIIQNYVDPPTQIVYNAAKIETTSYTITDINFDHAFAKDAIQALANVAQGYEFGVDNSREFYFRAIDTAVRYYYWAGMQFQDIDLDEDPLSIRNKLYVKSGKIQTDGTNWIGNVLDQSSIDAYGLREDIVTAPDILNTTDALEWAAQILAEKKDPKAKAKIKNVIFDVTKAMIEAKGKIMITVYQGSTYTLPIKRVLYRISTAGTLGEIECGAVLIPFEEHFVSQLKRLDDEQRLSDKRTKELYGMIP